MGAKQSTSDFESPSDKHSATLYYFAGRGLADQIRWMLAATNVDFCQKIVSTREKFVEMAGGQLPFGQLPLLQIDGMEIVQSQAAVRYLARRAHLAGTSAQDALKCDMIAEAVRDVLSLLLACPFRKFSGSKAAANSASSSSSSAPSEEWVAHLAAIKEKWKFVGARFEAILRNNLPPSHPALAALAPAAAPAAGTAAAPPRATVAPAAAADVPVHIVGSSLTYADVLIAHLITWLVEECGSGVVADMPLLVQLQNQVISLPSVKRFIRSVNFFPVGDQAYIQQVSLGAVGLARSQ
jgi:glutathione S-transferase